MFTEILKLTILSLLTPVYTQTETGLRQNIEHNAPTHEGDI